MGKTYKDSIYKDKKVHTKKQGNKKGLWKTEIDIDSWDSTRYMVKKDNREFYDCAVEAVASSDIDYHHLCRTLAKSKDRMWIKVFNFFTKALNEDHKYIKSIFSDILHIIEFTETEFDSLRYRLQHRRKFRQQQYKIEQKTLGHFTRIEQEPKSYIIKSYDIQNITGIKEIMNEVQ